MDEPLTHVYSTIKANRVTDADEELEALRKSYLNLSSVAESITAIEVQAKVASVLAKLRHYIAEEMGDLPTRTSVEVSLPVHSSEVVGWDPNKFMERQQAKEPRPDDEPPAEELR
jgi:hypothetical protein